MKAFKPNWIPPPSRRPKRPETPERRERNDFYSSREWIKLRDLKRRLDPLCEPCKARGVVRVVAIVHHVETVEDRPDRRLDIDNLQSVCLACHNAIHKGKRR